ncbi:MAG: 50S ribosomal protein L15e [Candidatus Diapherotrites archaeon]|nr:50S ribosomal protein L15e [Candidatus Diapherotrites archaeon]
MGMYHYIRAVLQKEYSHDRDEFYDYRERLKEKILRWRREPAVVRIERPSNITRARELGYKAKQGIIVVRVRVRKGSGAHIRPNKGRRPKRMGVNKLTRRVSIQRIAEMRANRKYRNLEVLNSYYVGEDGQHYYYEVILVDPHHPAIRSDKDLKWIVEPQHRGRAFRGKTSAGRKGRGLRHKGKGAEKARPSLKANQRKLK